MWVAGQEEVLVASTGVIGVDLSLQKVQDGVTTALAALSRDAHRNALLAIMTTDPFPKESAVRVETDAGHLPRRRHDERLGHDRAAHGHDAWISDRAMRRSNPRCSGKLWQR
jgi:hypothetical protein